MIEAELGPRAMPTSRWHRARTMLAVSWCGVLILYADAAAAMVAKWSASGTFAHGFVVLPISLYLAWTRRELIAQIEPRGNPWPVCLFPLIGLVWWIGNRTDVLVLQQFALVAALQLVTWVVLGTALVRALLFPLMFLFFAVPIGEELTPPLQDLTAFMAAHPLRWSGVLVSWEGRILSTPTAEWHVANACSGIRYLIPAIVLGCVFASLTYRSWSRRVGFVLLCVIVPVLANGARVYGIIMLGHLTSNRFAVGVDHQIYGWLFFGLVMYPLFTLGMRWSEEESPHPPLAARDSRMPWSARAVTAAVCCGVLFLALGPAAARVLSAAPTEPLEVTIRPLVVRPPWHPVEDDGGDWRPTFRGAASEMVRTYRADSGDVTLYIGYYGDEHQGAELVNSENSLANAKHWAAMRDSQRLIVVDDQPVQARETVLRSKSGEHRAVWSWYWVANEFTASAPYAKILTAKAKLFGKPAGSAVIAVMSTYDPASPLPSAQLQGFLDSCPPWQDTLSGFTTTRGFPYMDTLTLDR